MEKNMITKLYLKKTINEFLLNYDCDHNGIVTIGYVVTKPIMSNNMEENKSKNKRVEIKFIN